MPGLATLQRLASDLGTPLDDTALDRFDTYRRLILEWNQRFNLTRVTDPEEIEIKLFADALAFIPHIHRYRTRGTRTPTTLVDIGTGAGLPGIALKIAKPTLDVLLIEATRKKVTFLDEVIQELALADIRARHGRAEDLAHERDLRGRFDIVTARGVARLPALLEISLPFCRRGGLGIFPKGQGAQEEADEAAHALKVLRARLITVEPLQIPELSGTVLVAVEQIGKIPAQYPRKPGIPARDPL